MYHQTIGVYLWKHLKGVRQFSYVISNLQTSMLLSREHHILQFTQIVSQIPSLHYLTETFKTNKENLHLVFNTKCV